MSEVPTQLTMSGISFVYMMTELVMTLFVSFAKLAFVKVFFGSITKFYWFNVLVPIAH